MADVKVQIVVDGAVHVLGEGDMAALLAACKQPKAFGGTEYKDPEYGTVEVKLRPAPGKEPITYTVVMGNHEWWLAEEQFKVKGIKAILAQAEGERNLTELYRISLSRHQKGITTEQVAMLRDYRPADGPTLKDAFDRACVFSKPAVFADEDVDPKAVAAVKAGLILAVTPPAESTTTT
jgi:hypothetical protein